MKNIFIILLCLFEMPYFHRNW
uniref:Uncharacterized protein n=1 Tax=Arundo donax TaxID=35708 RepID=A0A0A9A385_ARUDO